MDQEIWLLRSAYAAVGCALRSSHPRASKYRPFAARTPLWAACCLRRIRMPKTFVAVQCARHGLRIAFVAFECGRISSLCTISLLCDARAAVGCALLCRIRMRRMSLLCIAYLTNITNTTKVPSRGSHGSSNLAAPQCVRRCGLRIAFVASAGFKISSLCSAHAPVGCVLPSSHPNAEDFRCCAVRTPLWVAYCVCCFRTRKNFVSLHHFVALRCARRCGLRIAVSHPNAGECRCSASRTPLWAARCLVASVCLQGMFSR